MEKEDYGVLIDSFSKNTLEEVRVAINEYKGHKYLDIRIFYRNKDGKEYLPSKKGLTLPLDQYPKLFDCIVRLGETLGYDFSEVGIE